VVTGSWLAGTRFPILVSVFLPKLFHCTPSSRLACREASTKRTSSITCCGWSTRTALMISGANCRAITTARSSVTASGTIPDSMMRPLTEDTRKPPPVMWLSSSASRLTS